MNRLTLYITVLVVLALLVSGCATVACGCAKYPLTVFAASSLTTALDRLQDEYQDAPLIVSTGSSATLRTQIEQGAFADVFLSADTNNPRALIDGGHADGEMVAFATNKLTILVPDGNPAGITSPADLARGNVRIIAAGKQVPITQYAEQLVANLASLPGYPPDFAAAYEANIVSREDNVGAMSAKIELGEGDAAIVYQTDAQAADLTVQVPDRSNVVATYAGVVTAQNAYKTQAHQFLDWLKSPAAQRILGGLGFQPAP